MPSYNELKFYSSNQYTILLEVLENEKVTHPETYPAVARVGEKIRKSILRTGIFEELEPIPQLDDKK